MSIGNNLFKSVGELGGMKVYLAGGKNPYLPALDISSRVKVSHPEHLPGSKIKTSQVFYKTCEV
jgi:hypothetical protein